MRESVIARKLEVARCQPELYETRSDLRWLLLVERQRRLRQPLVQNEACFMHRGQLRVSLSSNVSCSCTDFFWDFTGQQPGVRREEYLSRVVVVVGHAKRCCALSSGNEKPSASEPFF